MYIFAQVLHDKGDLTFQFNQQQVKPSMFKKSCYGSRDNSVLMKSIETLLQS